MIVERARGLWHWTQRTRPWRTFSHFTNVGGAVLAGGMSYQALFAVFAGLWVGFGIFGIVLQEHPELLESVVVQINLFVPGLIGEPGSPVDVSMLVEGRVLSWTSLIAGLTLVWVALNWFTGTRRSIRIIFGLEVKEYRNALLLKVRDLLLAIGFFLAIIVSAILTIASSNITDLLLSWWGVGPDNWFFSWIGDLVRYGALYLFDVIVLVAINYFLAEVRVGLRRLLVGCALGGVVLFGLKVLGTSLLSGSSSNPLLTTFAVFIGLLLWFNFICRTVLLTSAWIATGADKELGLPEEP